MRPGPALGYGREIQRIITERLGAVAPERNDSDLARWLVSGESTPLLGTEEGALGELATTKRGLSNIDGRTIGLVLPTGSTDLRDEAAAIMRGVAWALDPPRDDLSKGDRTKLATRDDGGDANRVEPTMAELAGEGAAVILAALDPVSADRAVHWGEKNNVAVITLAVPKPLAPLAPPDAGAPPTPPTDGAPPDAVAVRATSSEVRRDWAFVAGMSRDAEIGALAEELVSRAVVKIVPIVPPSGSDAVLALARGTVELQPPVACDTAAAQSGEAHFPALDWKTARVHAWLVDAPSECARDLIRELGGLAIDGTVALTLDAAGTNARASGVKELCGPRRRDPDLRLLPRRRHRPRAPRVVRPRRGAAELVGRPRPRCRRPRPGGRRVPPSRCERRLEGGRQATSRRQRGARHGSSAPLDERRAQLLPCAPLAARGQGDRALHGGDGNRVQVISSV